MNESFESDAHDYLLNQMDPARRLAFEQLVQQNEQARAALKASADSLAEFARELARAEPLSPSDQQAALQAIVAATTENRGTRGAVRRAPWRARRGLLLWAAAAVFVLAVNLFDFRRPIVPGQSPRTDVTNKQEPPRTAQGDSRDTSNPPDSLTQQDPMPTPLPGDPGRLAVTTASETLRELERLRSTAAELQQAHERLRAEYDLLVRRLSAQSVPERDLNRLSTMELVDAGSYARGERKGLVNVGRVVLTEPGVVVVPEPGPPPLGTGSTAPVPKQPYAWSVFDEKERRGYLNLYNLPTLPSDQSMQVWVRSGEADAYQRVGEVPSQFHGRSGSVQYTLPSSSSVPTEILITIESRALVPTAPGGSTVLRGP